MISLFSKVRFSPAVLLLFLLAVSFSLHLRLVEYADDDAYIHMRIARNLWSAGEPYFNMGEAVMASTSPLWVLISSPAAVGGELQPMLVAVINALLLPLIAVVWSTVYSRVFEPSGRFEHWIAGLLVFFTAAPSSVGLMETPCALLFAGISFLGIFKGRWWGLPSGVAAVFVRPECAVFCIAAVALKVLRRRVWQLSEMVGSVVVAMTLLSFQLFHFGSLYPHTARVKEIVYELTGKDFIRFAFISGYGEWAVKTALPLLVAAFFAATVWTILKSTRIVPAHLDATGSGMRDALLVFVLPAVTIFFVYAAKRVFIFPWYAPLFLVPAHLAVLRVLFVRGGSIRVAAALLLMPLAIVSCQIMASLPLPSSAPFFEAGARARHLKRVGSSLAAEFPQAVMMAPEIGGLGFSFSGKIIDSVGLASPEALPFHPLRIPEQRPTGFHGGVPAAFVEQEKPTLIVGLESFMQDFLHSTQSAAYEIRRLLPVEDDDMKAFSTGRIFGSTALIVAVRRHNGLAPFQEH